MSRLTPIRPEERAVAQSGILTRVLWAWVSAVTTILSGRQPLQLAEYTVNNLPDASAWKGCVVAVTDESGGYVAAFSDGVHWLRVTDRTEVMA